MNPRVLFPLSLLASVLAAQGVTQPDPVADAWQAFLREQGTPWTAHFSAATGTPYAIYGEGLRVSPPVGALGQASVLAANLLDRYAALLGRGDSRFVETISAKVNQTYVLVYDQTFRGLTVIGGRADVRLHESGVVSMFGSRAAPIPADMATVPGIGEDAAWLAAWRHVEATPPAAPLGVVAPRARLVIWAQVEGAQPTPVRLAWEVNVDQRTPTVVVQRVYVDAQTGRVLEAINQVYECGLGHTHVHGDKEHGDRACSHDDGHGNGASDTVATPPAPGALANVVGNVKSWVNDKLSPLQPLANLDMANIRVSVAGGNVGFTDQNGNFDIPHTGTTPVNVTVGYNGRYMGTITPQQGSVVSLTQSVTPGVPANLQMLTASATDFEWSQPTIYFWVDKIWLWMDNLIVGGAAGKARIATVTATCNRPSTCNAFYSGNTINFYAAGGGCNMTGFSTVVTHEWGHGLDDAFGGISQTDGLSEGWGDMVSILLTGQPIVGQDFTTSGGIVRNALNTFQYPAGGGVHQQGQTWMGFGWTVRNEMIAKFGQQQGADYASRIIVGSIVADATNQPDAVREVFVLDDNDGNLNNGTPNYTELERAARSRSLPFPQRLLVAITHTALTSTETQLTPRIVSADVTAFNGTITSLDVVYDAGAGVQRRPMQRQTGTTFRALLPGTLSPQSVSYHIEARHSTNVTVRVPETGEYSYAVGLEQVFFTENFDTGSVGWTHALVRAQDDWQLGTPGGASGSSGGIAWTDPGAAASGAACWGNDLAIGNFNGAYQPNVTNYLRSPVLDMSGRAGVTLKFKRWLTVQESTFDQARILVNGTQVWVNPAGANNHTLDTAWTDFELLVPQANNNPAVTLEWNLNTNGSVNLGGWAIDDVSLFSFSALPAPVFQYRANPEQPSIGTPSQISLQGAAGAPVVILLSATSGPTNFPGVGNLAVGATFVPVVLGLDGSGNATFPLTAPNALYLIGQALYSQAVQFANNQLTPSNAMVHLFQN